jgi:hypothetical protein
MMRTHYLKQLAAAAAIALMVAAAPALALARGGGHGGHGGHHGGGAAASHVASSADRGHPDFGRDPEGGNSNHSFTHDESEFNEGFYGNPSCSFFIAPGCQTHP